MGSPSEDARELLALALGRPATLGSGRLICLDGPAGSGKTTLATALADLAPAATVVHTDELLEGWQGLADLHRSVCGLLAPLSRGEAGTWRRWDWEGGRWAGTHLVEPCDLLVLDGVGSWSPSIAAWATVLAWVEAPHDVRMLRGIARDGDAFAPYWDQWARDEDALFARDRTRDHADVVIET